MTQDITELPASRSLLDIVERASLFALLQQALESQQRPQELPNRLYHHLNIPPGQRPDFASRFRQATVF